VNAHWHQVGRRVNRAMLETAFWHLLIQYINSDILTSLQSNKVIQFVSVAA